MAFPAPESLMLDALVTELQKIGTAPATNWNTQSTPTLKLGFPGDPVPHPNAMTLWLQHLGTEFVDAESGATWHRIRATFGIYIAASAAQTAMQDALGLLHDVRRILFDAEGRLGALFDGGVWPGEFRFSAPSGAPGGVYLGEQQYSLVATVMHDGSLATDPTMLSYEAERTLLRSYPFAALPTQERMSAGMRQTLQAPSLILESTAAGANKMAEVRVEEILDSPFFVGPNGEQWPQYMTEIAAQILLDTAATPTATTYAGIELGTYDQLPPFPSAANNAVAQLRWNFGSGLWELVCGVGDAVTADTIVPVTGAPAIAPGGGARLRLIYDPVNQKVQGIVNGVIAEISTVAALPQFGAYVASPLVAGLFVTSGSSNAGMVRAIFSACHCKTYNPTLSAAALWY